MKTGPRDVLLLFLCWILLSVFGGGWATTSLAAEALLTPLEGPLSDRGADRVLAIEAALDREAPLAALAQTQFPVEEAGAEGQNDYALGTVPRLAVSVPATDVGDRTLVPAAPLGSTDSPSVVESLIPSSTHGISSIHPQR